MDEESKGTFIPIGQLLPDPSEADWSPPDDLLTADSIEQSFSSEPDMIEVALAEKVRSLSTVFSKDQVSSSLAEILNTLSSAVDRLNVEGAELFKSSKHSEAAHKAEQGRALTSIIERLTSIHSEWAEFGLIIAPSDGAKFCKVDSNHNDPPKTRSVICNDGSDAKVSYQTSTKADYSKVDAIISTCSLPLEIAYEAINPLPVVGEMRWRIGKHELDQRSYEQIMIWMGQLKSDGHEPTLDQFAEILDEAFAYHQEFSDPEKFDQDIVDMNQPWIVNGQIKKFELDHFGLKKLDLSNVPGITSLSCSRNQLTELDLSATSALTDLSCGHNQLTLLDLSAVPGLTTLWCPANPLIELNLNSTPKLTSLSLAGNKLVQLNLTSIPELQTLICSGNELSELDLFNNSNLRTLRCSRNQLTELDLSNAQYLRMLECRSNNLTQLDLSRVRQLRMLDCGNNQLIELDVSNLSSLLSLSFCKNKIAKIELPSAHSLWFLTCVQNQLTDIDLSNVPVLRYLRCSQNKLAELDLSSVPDLEKLWCDDNQIIELDLSNVSCLTNLSCRDNQLTELELSKVPMLKELDCTSNRLEVLELSRVKGLTSLQCSDNRITQLDISCCPDLHEITCDPQVRVLRRPEQRVRHPD